MADRRLHQREIVGIIILGDRIGVLRSMGRISPCDTSGLTPTSWEHLSCLIISNYYENFAPGNYLYFEKLRGQALYYKHLPAEEAETEFKV